MMQGIKESFSFLISSFQTYSEGNYIWILYLLSLPVIFFLGKKEERKLFLGVLGVEILTIFNPVFVHILVEVFGFGNRYLRFFWMLVFYMTVAYAMVILIFALKSRIKRITATIICMVLIVVLGTPVFWGKDVPIFAKVENPFFTSNYMVSLSSEFHKDGVETPRVLYDGWHMLNYRQYDPTVTSFVSREIFDKVSDTSLKKFLKWKKCTDTEKTICRVFFYEDFTVAPEEFAACLEEEAIDYVVSRSENLDAYLEYTGIELAADTVVSRIWKVE